MRFSADFRFLEIIGEENTIYCMKKLMERENIFIEKEDLTVKLRINEKHYYCKNEDSNKLYEGLTLVSNMLSSKI